MLAPPRPPFLVNARSSERRRGNCTGRSKADRRHPGRNRCRCLKTVPENRKDSDRHRRTHSESLLGRRHVSGPLSAPTPSVTVSCVVSRRCTKVRRHGVCGSRNSLGFPSGGNWNRPGPCLDERCRMLLLRVPVISREAAPGHCDRDGCCEANTPPSPRLGLQGWHLHAKPVSQSPGRR